MTLLDAVLEYTRTHPGASPFMTPVDGLLFLRSDAPKPPSHRIFRPSLCVTLQGAKRSTFGRRTFTYAAGEALVVSVEMPAVSKILAAGEAQPYVGLVLELDDAAMRDMLERIDTLRDDGSREFAVHVARVQGPLEDALVRLVRLLDTPDAARVLAPLMMREISYWLLSGPHGAAIARFVLGSSRPTRLVEAINVLRSRFDQALRVEDLADVAKMSPSTFYREFKALTSMTPLQYQKHLRLLQARQLMLSGAANAESAGYQVGYESPSQFNREYARMFGAPPRRDVSSLGIA